MTRSGVVVRLAVHGAAALWTAAWMLRVPGGMVPGIEPAGSYVLAVGVAAVMLAWSANLYNFMDGIDGLAGAMTLIGFGGLGLASADDALRTLTLALAFAAIPFLTVNRPPARLFLGDVGAVPAGFLAAAFGLAGVVRDAWPAWFPILAFLPFIAYASDVSTGRVRANRVDKDIDIQQRKVEPADLLKAAARAGDFSAYLEAPLSGFTVGAQACTLTLMVGGDAATLDAARAALDPFAGLIVHVGGPGMGQVVKL